MILLLGACKTPASSRCWMPSWDLGPVSGIAPEADTSVSMMAGATERWKGEMAVISFCIFVFFGWSSFGNFVFWDYGAILDLDISSNVDL